MTQVNPFVLDKQAYVRDISVLKHYINDAAFYLSTMTGQKTEVSRAWVLNQMKPGGKFEFKDPNITYFERGDNGDRKEVHGTMASYIAQSVQKKELIAPTFTTYLNPSVKKSELVDFIDGNVKARGLAKKAQFRAKMAGDTLTEILKKTEQTNKKLSNNALSGAHVSASTPLNNKTAHSTLTSNCRVTSGFGNANNEKLLCGNRHYWNPNLVINNIVSIISHTDYSKLEAAMRKHNLRHPSVEETIKCVTYSTDLYWRNEFAIKRITALIVQLTDIQRSAFVYTGDLYHLMLCNETFVRQFITDLTTKVAEPDATPGETIHKYREEYQPLVSQFFPNQMKGKVLGEKEKKFIGLTDPITYGRVASTIKHLDQVITVDYADFIDAFLVTTNVPASLAYFPLSVRRAALVSDTDSTIFTVQDWVIWYQGNAAFTETASAVSATMIFLAAETITHILARMSANFGIETTRIHQVAMKNEFKFDVFVPTQVGKHYFAVTTAQEGNLFGDFEMEIKGVHLKSSNVPVQIMKEAKKMMKDIIQTVLKNEKISLRKFLKRVGDIEREVKRSVLAGESTYFRKATIKNPQSYKQGPEESPYQHHTLWKEVFGPKYGHVAEPPYGCLKICVDVSSKVALKKWVDSIEDKALQARLSVWMARTKKNGMQSLQFSEEALNMAGMPVEVASILDMRKTIFDVTGVFYIILETLGSYWINKNLTRLVSDEY